MISAMWGLAPCLLLMSAVTVTDARHGCTTCPNNGCYQSEAHNGFCYDERYDTESYQCSYSDSKMKPRSSSVGCGWFSWQRCETTKIYYETVTHYHICNRSRLNCHRRCCSGYRLNGRKCEPYCTGGCHNGGVCIHPEACQCRNNWQGQYCKIDVDECTSNNGGCSDHCKNNPGSYSCACRQYAGLDPDGRHCTCRPGFRQNDNTVTCDDIDECADSNGRCDHYCTNTPGSYSCHCKTGYKLQGLKNCLPICTEECLNGGECSLPETCSCSMGWTGNICETDIDECTKGISGCDQHCANTVPGYTCSCDTGYTLNEDGHACDDVDECNSTDYGGCHHMCLNTPGSYNCSCTSGFTMGANNTCEGSDVTDVSGLAVPVIIVGLLLCIVTVTVIVLLQGPLCRKAAKYMARLCKRSRWARGVTQKNNVKDGVEPAMNESESNGIMFYNNVLSDNTPWDGGMQLPSNKDTDVYGNEEGDVVNNGDNDVGKLLLANVQCQKVVPVNAGGTQENKFPNIVQPTMDEDDDDTDDNDDDEKTRLLVKTK